MGDPVGVSRHARRALKDDGTVMIVEPFANDNVQDNLNPVGRVMYGASSQICTLKTPYRDGTTHVLFEPLDFLARLAALVPSPGVNLTRFHWRHPCLQPCGRPAAAQIGNPADLSWGVCAESRLASADRAGPARARRSWYSRAGQGSATPKHVSMSWAQRLKRVFGVEIQRCDHCGGAVKIIASIEDPEVIGRILQHLGLDRSEDCSRRPRPPIQSPNPIARSPSSRWAVYESYPLS